ncbi:hypothetical protein M378DRAFT_156252 [Amanita muscaria Koide BX008]|uniref:Gag1-like clamp domain-containing protein n=1 Tax=Amanita muscaria (strain Koide BX008) TaxID=946122 RepID=A0A0C2XM36_AMAMK|nr:hypothetical protein M378DRAFT_156252 [Amanita muscaria Koide BX008]
MSSLSLDFDQLLAAENLPPPGPAYYEARRQLWLTPHPQRTAVAPRTNFCRRRKLEKLVVVPEQQKDSDQYCETIRGLWKAICSSKRFNDRVPLRLMISIVHATWQQDETWPKGAIVHSSDEAQVA